MSAIDPELLDLVARHWLGQLLRADELTALVAAFDALDRGLGAIPDSQLHDAEPASVFAVTGCSGRSLLA